MALFILQPGLQPLGQFDFDDTDLPNVLGGEVGTLDEASRTKSTTNKGAVDAFDGYVADAVDAGTVTAYHPVLRIADTSSETRKLFYLLDDGKKYYGTMFGELIGAPVGQTFTSTNQGPHTAQGSGKVTAWDKPGLYAVSLDAVSTDWAAQGGSVSVNLNDTPFPGDLLYRGALTGKLTGNSTGIGSTDKIALFVEISGNGSLVTSPARLVGASEIFDRITIQYLGATHNA